MKKTRIEWNDLRAIGCSSAALDLYSNTDPLDIYSDGCGGYIMTGCIEACFENDGELRAFLEEMAGDEE